MMTVELQSSHEILAWVWNTPVFHVVLLNIEQIDAENQHSDSIHQNCLRYSYSGCVRCMPISVHD